MPVILETCAQTIATRDGDGNARSTIRVGDPIIKTDGEHHGGWMTLPDALEGGWVVPDGHSVPIGEFELVARACGFRVSDEVANRPVCWEIRETATGKFMYSEYMGKPLRTRWSSTISREDVVRYLQSGNYQFI